MEIRKIKGAIRDYPWGDGSYIASLLGRRQEGTHAELWFGAHPSAQSVTEDGTLLSELIRKDRAFLGPDWERHQGSLPFMMKVMDIGCPLALQCHPGKADAEAGWEREAESRRAGRAVSYADRNGKSELFLALSPVTALVGFRNAEEAMADLAVLVPASYGRVLKGLPSIRSLFQSLYDLPQGERRLILSEFRSAAASASEPERSGLFLTRRGAALECLRHHPDDISCLMPYLMNLVHMKAGEAMEVKPGTMHTYFHGFGIECSDPSDNTIRIGLTHDHIDRGEAGRIADLQESEVSVAAAETDGYGRTAYRSSSGAFTLLSVPSGDYGIAGDRLSIALVTEGSARFSSGGESLSLSKGECAIIPAALRYTLRCRGALYITEAGNAQ